MLQAGRSRVRLPMGSLTSFSNLPNPSRRSMTPGLTEPVTEMSTRRFLWVKSGRPKAESLTAIYEPTVWTMWDSRHLTAP
jgi:hypothetical protein